MSKVEKISTFSTPQIPLFPFPPLPYSTPSPPFHSRESGNLFPRQREIPRQRKRNVAWRRCVADDAAPRDSRFRGNGNGGGNGRGGREWGEVCLLVFWGNGKGEMARKRGRRSKNESAGAKIKRLPIPAKAGISLFMVQGEQRTACTAWGIRAAPISLDRCAPPRPHADSPCLSPSPSHSSLSRRAWRRRRSRSSQYRCQKRDIPHCR